MITWNNIPTIYRVEETKGLIDGMGTVGLAETNGHNGSIEVLECYFMLSYNAAEWYFKIL